MDELAAECGVARATIRQALDLLENEGLIERYRAKGTFVRQRPRQQLWCEVATDWSGLLAARDDAVIELPPVEFGQSGDIYFEFRTTSVKTMVLVHTVGTNGDFLKVSIITGNHIQLEYESGKGQQGVTVETAYRLDDDAWHSVLVERNRKEAMVVVDGARKGQIKEPIGPVRPMLLDQKLYVGATKDYTDGYVGCIRAMVINGVVADLVGEATKNPWGLYGVGVGCRDAGAFVPIETEPRQRIENDFDALGCGAFAIGVFDAKDELAAGVTRP